VPVSFYRTTLVEHLTVPHSVVRLELYAQTLD
jgi:hypothetical protein